MKLRIPEKITVVGWNKRRGSTNATKYTANEVRHGGSTAFDPPYLSPPPKSNTTLFSSIAQKKSWPLKDHLILGIVLRPLSLILAIVFSSASLSSRAQVKLEDTVKKSSKPTLPSTSQAEIKKTPPAPPSPPAQPSETERLTCLKTAEGCPTSFRTAAAAIAPAWYAKQEKDPKEAARSQQKAVAYLEKYKAHALKRGWEVNDIARAYAFFVSLTYNVYSTGKGPDPAQFDVMTKRIRNELSKDAKFQATGDRDRQFIYERLILVALDNEAGYVFAKQRNDNISQEKHRERAKFWLEDVMEKPVNQIPNYWN